MTPDLPPLVSASWLTAHLNEPDLVVLDCSWYLPSSHRDPGAEYRRGHIPGALRFDIDLVSDPDATLPHMLPSPPQFAEAAEQLGIRPTDRVICYDGSGNNLSAARVWWMFRVFGHLRVAVLDGGFAAWTRDTRPVQTGVAQRPRTGYRQPEAPRRSVCNREGIDTILAHQSPVQIVDARSAARFRGEEDEPRPGVKRGRIPGSLNLPFAALTDPETGLFRTPTALRALFELHGIDLTRPIVALCGSGVTACVLALGVEVIRASGEGEVGPSVAVYDGSWAEFGRIGDG